jgi:hypothetical protein
MGNRLRPGLDFDAIGGDLQTKEQVDIYAYLPTHEGYSSLEYEDLGERQKYFLKIFEEQGIEGNKRFARHHKKQYKEISALARELRSC